MHCISSLFQNGVKVLCQSWYWLLGLFGHSPSCFLDPWASRTYNPKFCIFCMPVPDNDINICKLSSFSSMHSRQSCLTASPSWNMRVVWPINNPTVTLSFCPLNAWSSFVLLGRDSLGCWTGAPELIFHLFRCSCIKWLLITSLPTTKEMPTVWPEWTPLVLYLANVTASPFSGIVWCPVIHTKVTFVRFT